MIVTDERLEHIKHHHPQDIELFEEHVCDCITTPDLIITDSKNAGTVFMIKKLADTNLNVVLRLVLAHEERKLQNSIMTFWRIRNRNLKKLMNKGEYFEVEVVLLRTLVVKRNVGRGTPTKVFALKLSAMLGVFCISGRGC